MSSSQRRNSGSCLRFLKWVSLLIGYLMIGALLFKLSEEDNGKRERSELRSLESTLRQQSNLTSDEYNMLKSTILKLEFYQGGEQWSFVGALYFAFTIITAIGYGHSVPQTKIGKFLCTLYAIGGVALWQTNAQMFAEKMNKLTAKVFRCVAKKKNSKFHIKKFDLICAGLFLLVAVILIGTLVFSYFEKWSYLESAYYCVMTLSTVGFGDYVAMQNHVVLEGDWYYVTFSFLYIVFGLTICGNLLNLIVLRSHPHGSGIRIKDCFHHDVDECNQRRRRSTRSSSGESKSSSDSEINLREFDYAKKDLYKATTQGMDCTEIEDQTSLLQRSIVIINTIAVSIKNHCSRLFCCLHRSENDLKNIECKRSSLLLSQMESNQLEFSEYKCKRYKNDSDAMNEAPTDAIQITIDDYDSVQAASQPTNLQTCMFEKETKEINKGYNSTLATPQQLSDDDSAGKMQKSILGQSIGAPPNYLQLFNLTQNNQEFSQQQHTSKPANTGKNKIFNKQSLPLVSIIDDYHRDRSSPDAKVTSSQYETNESLSRLEQEQKNRSVMRLNSFEFLPSPTTETLSRTSFGNQSYEETSYEISEQDKLWKDEDRLIQIGCNKNPKSRFFSPETVSRVRSGSESTYQMLPQNPNRSISCCDTPRNDGFFQFRDRNFSTIESESERKNFYRRVFHSKSVK